MKMTILSENSHLKIEQVLHSHKNPYELDISKAYSHEQTQPAHTFFIFRTYTPPHIYTHIYTHTPTQCTSFSSCVATLAVCRESPKGGRECVLFKEECPKEKNF